MKAIRCVQGLFAVAALLVSAMSWAGSPVAIIGSGPTSFAASSVGSTSTQTLTLTFNAEGNSGSGAALGDLGFSGANASDFTIIGGTCAQNSTQLNSTTPTCTVIVQYHASTSGAESANFTGSCVQVALVGGFTLSCNDNTGTILSLLGSVLATVVSLPSLDPRMLTALCMLLLVVGGYFAGRKKT